VFNLCEGVLGHSGWDAHFVLALELLGIPCCGCDAVSIALTQDKAMMKGLLRRIGARTPDGFAAAVGCPEDQLLADLAGLTRRSASGRVIIKPSREDAGVGVDATSVVADPPPAWPAAARCGRPTASRPSSRPSSTAPSTTSRCTPAAAASSPCRPGQIVFASTLAPDQRIVGWRAKWDLGSPEDLATASCIVREMPPALHAEITGTCRHVASTLGLTGYCRFDLREGADGQLHVLDVNANPDIGAGSGFRKALAAAGISFEDFLAELIARRCPASAGALRTAA
jgi:D-alanine-D-alanine ligase